MHLVAGLRAGERPAPTRGARLVHAEARWPCSSPASPTAALVRSPTAAADAPTLRGTRLAEDNSITAPRYDLNTPIPAAPAKEGAK